MRIRYNAFSAVVVFVPDMSSFYRLRILTLISFFLPSAFGCREDQVQGEQVLGTRLLEASVAMVAGELEKLARR